MIFENIILFFLDTNITKVNFEFIKDYIGYILITIVLFSLIANIIPATLSFFIGFICKDRKIIQFEKENYLDKDKLLIQALKNQNLVDYQYLQQHKEEEIYLQSLKNYALLFSFSLASNSFFTNSIMQNLEEYLNTNFMLTAIFGILGIALFLFIQMVLCNFTDKVYYPKEAITETQQSPGKE